MDSALPHAEAIAIMNDRIHAVSDNKEISALAGPKTSKIDLRGATVLPGFIDSHIHLIEYGLSLQNVELRDADSIEEMKRRVSAKALATSGWILGRGWDQERFLERRYPTRHDLDEASADRPVLLRRVCGHVSVVNTAALRLAGITAETPDPEGGAIDKDGSSEPTGLLRETAIELVDRKIPKLGMEQYEKATLTACKRAVEAGLTGVHCIIDSEMEMKVLLKLRAEKRLPLRFSLLISVDQFRSSKQLGLRSGFGDEWVRIGAVKIYTDGSLGARTAALEAPYSDDPQNRGMTIYRQEELDEIIMEAYRSDFQVAVHAIGDRAARMFLEAIEKAMSKTPSADLRPRIEHASVLNPEFISRLRIAKVIASIQPHFTVSDFWIKERLGIERARFTYPFSNLLRNGVVAVGGSDCPVEPLTPLSGIAAAVHRPGSGEAMDVEDAILLYTRNAAYASFEEDLKGTISPGKCADLVVLSEDPRMVEHSRISELKILMTMVGGKTVYEK